MKNVRWSMPRCGPTEGHSRYVPIVRIGPVCVTWLRSIYWREQIASADHVVGKGWEYEVAVPTIT